MKELQPINQNVLLKPIAIEQKTAGGIILPDSVDNKSDIAEVISLSNIDDVEIEIGDKVFYKSFSGNQIKFENSDFLLIKYDDILAKVVETEEI